MAAGCKNTNLLAGLNELFDGHDAVPVFVHFLEEITRGLKKPKQNICLVSFLRSVHLEELVHVFVGSLIAHTRVGVPPHHVIDGLHNRQHFLQAAETEMIWMISTTQENNLRIMLSWDINTIFFTSVVQLHL